MVFEWDENKNRINKAKHGVDFEMAVTVFDDPCQASRLDNTAHHEERWQTIGMSEGLLLLLFVVHTWQEAGETIIRVLSARKATAYERNQYEKGSF